MTASQERPRVLVLSRNYPNNVLELKGLWVRSLVQHTAERCELKVVSPVPYCPPLPGLPQYTRFRRTVRQRDDNDVQVFYPRFIVGPGRSLYDIEALMYLLAVRGLVARLRESFPFDLIHAHFGYPDGVVAARLGARYRVPVVVTEHAPWRPNWMDRWPIVRRQTLWAAKRTALQIPVSSDVGESIVHFTRAPGKIRVVPNGVDGSVFRPPESESGRKPHQILYVGVINFNKGIDLLLQAVREVVSRKPAVKLLLVGGSFYRDTLLQEQRLRRMAHEMDLESHVEFLGMKSPLEVARHMGESGLLVLPSRAESFGSVLVEALACGTPVVSTRCGGPEDIVTDEVGVLVPTEDVEALASAIELVLEGHRSYDPSNLRRYALEHFSWERVARRVVDLYGESLASPH